MGNFYEYCRTSQKLRTKYKRNGIRKPTKFYEVPLEEFSLENAGMILKKKFQCSKNRRNTRRKTQLLNEIEEIIVEVEHYPDSVEHFQRSIIDHKSFLSENVAVEKTH